MVHQRGAWSRAPDENKLVSRLLSWFIVINKRSLMDFTFDQVACDFVAGACLMKGNCSGALFAGEYTRPARKSANDPRYRGTGHPLSFLRRTFAAYRMH